MLEIAHYDGIGLDLPENQAADMFLWLVEIYPPDEDPVHNGPYSPGTRDFVARFRDSFLSRLVNKGTEEAVAELRRIKKELPNLSRLDYMIIDAVENLREASWSPPSPAQLFRILRCDEITQKIRKLELESADFEGRKLPADIQARRRARFSSFERLGFIYLVLGIVIWAIFKVGWTDAEVWTFVGTLLFGAVLLGVACFYLVDDYWPLKPGTILNDKQQEMYRKYNISLAEGDQIKNDLALAKRELRRLDELA